MAARPPDPAMIAKHHTYFRPADPPPNSPRTTPENYPIIGWDVFLIHDLVTPCYCPVVIFNGAEIHASNRLWCSFCPKWVQYSDSVSHYKRHVSSHEQRMGQIRELSPPTSISYAIVAFILKRGEPASALDSFRCFPFGEWLPTGEQMKQILKILRDRVETDIRVECERSDLVNIALDGWSDPRGRRYQGVTARLVHPDTLTTWTRLLAMKEIRSLHQSSGELRVMLERLESLFNLCGKILNLCTDRASINESAFRTRSRDLSSIFDGPLLWLPCACHLLNNILSSFFDKIRQRLKPIFTLQQRFRKCGPFLVYLVQKGSLITSITP
jgi:hypothetical protein